MKQQIVQLSSGLHFHVEYMPRTNHSKPRIHDVRLAGPDYEPVGPNIRDFLHDTYTLTERNGEYDAVRVLETIIQEVESHE